MSLRLQLHRYNAKKNSLMSINFLKGANNFFFFAFLAFVRFPVFLNDTIMCQFFRQEIKQKRTFDVEICLYRLTFTYTLVY